MTVGGDLVLLVCCWLNSFVYCRMSVATPGQQKFAPPHPCLLSPPGIPFAPWPLAPCSFPAELPRENLLGYGRRSIHVSPNSSPLLSAAFTSITAPSVLRPYSLLRMRSQEPNIDYTALRFLSPPSSKCREIKIVRHVSVPGLGTLAAVRASQSPRGL